MAQRGGVVESAIVFGDAKSTIISDGEADVLVGFEPSETLRALNKCHQNTTVITNMAPLPPFTVAIGRGTYPDLEQLKTLIRSKTKQLIAFDAVEMAESAGSVMAVNIVLLGALIRTGILPITREKLEAAIRTKTKASFVDVNLKAFALGFGVSADVQ